MRCRVKAAALPLSEADAISMFPKHSEMTARNDIDLNLGSTRGHTVPPLVETGLTGPDAFKDRENPSWSRSRLATSLQKTGPCRTGPA